MMEFFHSISRQAALRLPVRLELSDFRDVTISRGMTMETLFRRMPPFLFLGLFLARAIASGDDDLRFWLQDMIWYHNYNIEEMAKAMNMSTTDIERAAKKFGITRRNRPSRKPGAPLLVLPYPGGRHPRIGFLDGAINPMRGTKFSVFLPWANSGYIVVDLPEALWADGELIFLAHTHIPTVWDKKGIKLEDIDWTRGEGGRLRERRILPNGVAIECRVVPRREFVDMEMRVTNGSSKPLHKMRAQICIMLKGTSNFNTQTRDNKVLSKEVAAVKSKNGTRWIFTAWDSGRPWENPLVPCIHSDPGFPDCSPGESVVRAGRLFFFEGKDLSGKVARLRKEKKLHWRMTSRK